MSFWDKIVAAAFQVVFIIGVVYCVDRLCNCCRRVNPHPIPPSASYPLVATRAGPHIPVPNPM